MDPQADVHAPALQRILRALAGRGVFAETESGKFELTPLAELLKAHIDGRGRLLVIPEVAHEARSTLEEAGVTDRSEVIE